jgi:hypothetical protein
MEGEALGALPIGDAGNARASLVWPGSWLAADHHAARGGEGAAPPAVVSALWRPWRRMRLA